MTDANTIREAIRSTYRARVRGDLEGTVALFADDAVFDFNGQGVGLPNMGTAVRGKPAIRLLMAEFIDAFRMSDWEEVSLVVEGDKAALHWSGTVTIIRLTKSILKAFYNTCIFLRKSTCKSKMSRESQSPCLPLATQSWRE